jgi:hypothetical protein
MIKTELFDQLADALKTELILRHEASIEMANGNRTGPMMQAHTAIVSKIIELAKEFE